MPDIESPNSRQLLSNSPTTLRRSYAIRNTQYAIRSLLWGVTALVVTLLALRFAMRLLGVRPDIPFPGFVYALTDPLVQPFYRFFPVSDRFDYYAAEWASLLAAGCMLAIALVVYVVVLLLYNLLAGTARKRHTTGVPRT